MINCTEHLWVPMPDGARLGARLWLPDNHTEKPLPTILEYIPYRKDDYSAIRDSSTIAWFASRGYATLRVDMRGSGSSDGVMYDEYSDQEIDDGVSVINWIAEQNWCDGNVATIGISWGGITGLQLAQRAPKPLKTIIVLGASEFRYYDDGSYYMGCMVGQTIGWATLMFGYNTRPPDPNLVGDKWRSLWLERLNETPHYLDQWLTHQHQDEYWLRGTVGTNYDAIKIPVYAVSGHADCWPNTVSRLLKNLSVPTRGIQGAWCHRYPHLGVPGPTVNFLEDAARWFDHWLKGEDTDIMDESRYQVYLQDSVKPKPYYDYRPGKWVGEPSWPSPNVEVNTFYLAGLDSSKLSLSSTEVEKGSVCICSPQTIGLAGGEYMPWFVFGPSNALPDDQRKEDDGSLVFDLLLKEDTAILGNADVELTLSSDQSQSLVAARLCDVWPDGSSTLITRGILNLSQRHGKGDPTALIPGENASVTVKMNHVGYVVPKGHILRLALSTSYWPIAWPSPNSTTLSIITGLSKLLLPIRKMDAEEGVLTEFSDQPGVANLPTTQLREVDLQRSTRIDKETGCYVFEIVADNGKTKFDGNGVEMGSTSLQRCSIHPDKPSSATAEYEWVWEYSRGSEWKTKTFTQTVMTCDEHNFYVKAVAMAWEQDEKIFERAWEKTYPRDHF